MYKDIHQVIDQRLAPLKVSADRRNKMLHLESSAFKKVHRPFTLAIASCLCVILVLAVAVASLPGLRNFILPTSSQAGVSGMASNGAASGNGADFGNNASILSCEDQGFKVSVVSAQQCGNSSVIRVSVQDLTGDRLSDTAQLRLSTGTPMNTWHLVRYDSATQTAYFDIILESIRQNTDRLVPETLYLQSITQSYERTESFQIDVDLSSVSTPTDTQMLDLTKGFGSSGTIPSDFMKQGEFPVLTPDAMRIALPGTSDCFISNIGIVDGKLHVQLLRDPPTPSAGGPGSLLLMNRNAALPTWDTNLDDPKGSYIRSVCGVFFAKDKSGKVVSQVTESYEGQETQSSPYTEYVYEITAEELWNLQLIGLHFANEGSTINGQWSLQIPRKLITQVPPKTADCKVDISGFTVNQVTVALTEITLEGTGTLQGEAPLELLVTDANGKTRRISQKLHTNNLAGHLTCEGYLPDSLDPDRVALGAPADVKTVDGISTIELHCGDTLAVQNLKSITLNGQVIPLS